MLEKITNPKYINFCFTEYVARTNSIGRMMDINNKKRFIIPEALKKSSAVINVVQVIA